MRRFAILLVLPFALLLTEPVSAAPSTSIRPSEPNLADQGTLGTEAGQGATSAVLSGNGNVVAFSSASTNLVTGDTNAKADIFVRELDTGLTERVSVSTAGAQSTADSIGSIDVSPDGRFVTFSSGNPTLAAGPTSCLCQYLRDRMAGTTEWVGIGDGPDFGGMTMTDDGRYFVFATLGVLVPEDVNPYLDVYGKDRFGGFTLVSANGAGDSGNHQSYRASVTPDGSRVIFTSRASDLVVGDTNGLEDTFVRNLGTSAMERVSVGAAENEAEGVGDFSALSADGRIAVFVANDTDLVPGGTNGAAHLFARDLIAGTTEVISVDSDEVEAFGSQSLSQPSISSDGRFVAFESNSVNPINPDCFTSIHVRDRVTGITAFADVSATGVRADCPTGGGLGNSTPHLSSSGQRVAYTSWAFNLIATDTNGTIDAYVRDLGDHDSDGEWDPFDGDADSDGDGMTNGYEDANPCLDRYAPDGAGDTDGDGLTALAESGVGTDPCAVDTDLDGCSDGEEVGDTPSAGGVRDPLFPHDFYDVNGSKKVDAIDIAQVRSRFPSASPDPPYAATHDRSPGSAAWAPGAPNGVINAVDIALVRASFTHSCQPPP